MVYCVKCGTKNDDEAKVCAKCGTQLYVTGESEHYRRMENECFGIPRGGTIVGLIIGIMIVFAGFSYFLQVIYPDMTPIPWWPLLVIMFGALMIVGAIYGLRRRY
jgi:ABC-type antimicrobial peptide transport system permease subunit